MGVLQVLTPASFGGIEVVVEQLVEGLCQAGEDVAVIALGGGPHAQPYLSRLRDRGGVVLEVPGRHGIRHEAAALHRLLEARPDAVLHSHGYRADLLVGYARCRGQRWVSTVHGFTHLTAKLTVYQVADRLALRFADAVIAVSEPLVQDLRRWGVPGGRVHLVRNVPRRGAPIGKAEARRRLGLDPARTVVGWVGRFSPEKGPDRLGAVAAALGGTAELVLVGDGPERPAVLEALAAMGEDRPHRWLGRRDDIGMLMAAFDVLILPSRTEGMPLTVLEAMAAGVPVVAFDVGDVRAVVGEETGWLVRAGDVAAFVDAVGRAVTDADGRARRGLASARLMATRFSGDGWIAAHRALYAGGGTGSG